MVRDFLSCDIETTGLDPFKDKIIGLAFSDKPGFAVHFDWPAHIPQLYKQPLCFQNGIFDVCFLRQNGVKHVNYVHDTKYMQHVIAPDLPKSLAFFNSIYSPYPYYKEFDDKDSKYAGRKIRTIIQEIEDREIIRQYCCRDADVTRIAAKRLLVEMKLENVEKPYYEIMIPLANTSINMRLRGTPIDESRLEQAHNEVVGTYDQLQASMEAQGWNPRSTHQMKQLLDAVGLNVGKSLDKDALEKLWDKYPDHPILAAIIRHRKLDTDRKVYESMMRSLRNGRIHTDWDPSGTRTGRIASRDPNLMNLTEHHRDIFIADPGMNLMSADYSRLEIMVAAARSNDPDMINDAWNKDIHAEYRKWVYGKEEMPYYETRVAKMIVFGAMYGRSAKSIAQQFKVTVNEAQRMIDHLMNRYPTFNRQLEEDKRVAATEGKIRTPFGRVRHFYEGNIKSMAVNTPIQSGAADITLKSLNRLESETRSLAGDVLMSVHDQIIIQYPRGEEQEYYSLMKDVMETPVPELGNRRFPIEVKIGPNWKDLKVYARNKA